MATTSGRRSDYAAATCRPAAVRAPASRPSRRLTFDLAAGALWLGTFGLIIGLLLAGRLETIPFHVYAAAGRRWLMHAPLYNTHNIDGFQYFPQSAMIFAPIAALGSPYADVLWRALEWTLYAWGVWRLARTLFPQRAHAAFLVATCLSVGPAAGGLGNGQANLALAALTWHAAVDLSERRFWRAASIIGVGFALKPLMAVMLLLVAALYRPMRLKLAALIGLLFALPWAVRDSGYVMAQYRACLTKLSMCENPGRLFEDARSLFESLGVSVSHANYLVVQTLSALLVLGLCAWVRRQTREPVSSFLVAAFAVLYLMLFNPRTLSTSYVMPLPAAAMLVAGYLFERRWPAAAAAVSVVLAWTLNYHLVHWVQHWLRPVAAIGLCVLLVGEALTPARLRMLAERHLRRTC